MGAGDSNWQEGTASEAITMAPVEGSCHLESKVEEKLKPTKYCDLLSQSWIVVGLDMITLINARYENF